ncbi:NADH dehydrogenase [ubiquinone] 1 beta subcomplex subunit 10-B [Capsicum annuum]|uniref:NADH dehydrogenase [ubiquinone] 1 beta subcomplex subunit 10-B n=1 Tax=Capsicum annuum TaxID=4072 RepID=A0A2G2YSS0_CAPAN|nr:NADH dehydrogenase [ubiquinone] 1 beta subcomplex subunit 10-B [Capsicum annuum]
MGRKKGVEFDEGAPDDFDPNNPYKDLVAFFEMRKHLVREKWVDIEKAKILREKLRWCCRIEGVNHLQKALLEVYVSFHENDDSWYGDHEYTDNKDDLT